MPATGFWAQFLRCRLETSFNASAPQTANDWSQGVAPGGANGWIDIYDQIDSAGLVPNIPLIFPTGKSGSRLMNTADPVAGGQEAGLGSLTFPVYPELADRFLQVAMGVPTRTPTAGSAAQAATAFASLATLTTQPADNEQLSFTIASSTAASGASINVIQSGVTVETISIPDSASSVDGVYYMRGYVADGSTNNVTFTVAGTVTAGTVAVAGVSYVDVNFKVANSTPSMVIEQAGRVESGSGNSEFFPGCKIPTIQFAYDRSAADNLLLMTSEVNGLYPTTATSTTYADEASTYYRPFAGWLATVEIDDTANTEIISANININGNAEHFAVSDGNRGPGNVVEGMLEAFGTFTVVPNDSSRWDDFDAATPFKLEVEFLTPFYIEGTTPYRFKYTFNRAYIETYTRNAQGAAQGAEIAFRAVRNDTDVGPVQIDVRGRLPV